MHRLKVAISGLLIFSFLALAGESPNLLPTQKPEFIEQGSPWADSVLASMSLEEKIGQLFNIAAYSNKGEQHQQQIQKLIEEHHIGGLTFFQGGPHRQAKLTNYYQSLSKVPLMIAMDGEWGLAMRLDSVVKYPWQMTLGAVENDSLIEAMGFQIAEQFRRLGVHVNFAPVVDVNNNPNNPVINARSFGEDKKRVAAKGVAYMRGLQKGKVLANAKHFPGHGDTDADSHKTLPIVDHTLDRIDSVELYPFKELIKAGLGSVMTAHLYLPAFKQRFNTASSLTPAVVDTLLRQQMEFEGLIFTDGLNMKGVSGYFKSSDIDLKALQAGNDVLLLSQDVPAAVAAIKKAIADSVLSEAQLTASCHKILKAKEWLGIHQTSTVELDHLIADLNQEQYHALNRQLAEAAQTVLKNENEVLPIRSLKDKKMIALAFGKGNHRPFHKSLNRYAKVDTLHYVKLPVSAQKTLMDSLSSYDVVMVSFHVSNKHPWKKYKIDEDIKNFINLLRTKKQVIFNLFGNAYALRDFLATEYVDGLIVNYQNSALVQESAAQLIFGGVAANGSLPVSVSKAYPVGSGLIAAAPIRLKFANPIEAGMSAASLSRVDSIVLEGINAKAYPGVQVLIARKGKVVYHKAFGKPTYKSERKVSETDLYDIASVTKISATLLAVMDLQSKGKLSLDDRLGRHLKLVRGTEFGDLTLREMLAHQAGLAAWIPFYIKTLHHGLPRYDLYTKEASKNFSTRVAENLYIKNTYRDTIFYRIMKRTKINPKKEYRYSDIGYYFLKEMVEEMVKMPIEDYLDQNFYQPLGMSRTTYKPREKFPLEAIIPTENDKVFRKQLIHGDVHDPGAAMLGGVGGHAGLFSNAMDLAKLMQLYLNQGEYAGEQYLNTEVLKEYTRCQYCKDSIPKMKAENRRAAGFDKPALHGEPGPTCDCVSFNSFGHSGFTGTYAWVDPEEEVVYVFLSNRVYPNADNKKLVRMNIRTRIQEVIYEAIAANEIASMEAKHPEMNHQP